MASLHLEGIFLHTRSVSVVEIRFNKSVRMIRNQRAQTPITIFTIDMCATFDKIKPDDK